MIIIAVLGETQLHVVSAKEKEKRYIQTKGRRDYGERPEITVWPSYRVPSFYESRSNLNF